MQTVSQRRSAIDAHHRDPEAATLARLLPLARRTDAERLASDQIATTLLTALRADDSATLVERFMREYTLGSPEGIALLSLAEAYLRVPDRLTADQLIRDKIGEADWSAHQGASDSRLVNLTTLGLMLVKGFHAHGAALPRRMLAGLSAAPVRAGASAAMRMMGGEFVLGRTIGEALGRARRTGVICSFDMLGEAARTDADARRYYDAYARAIDSVGHQAEQQLGGHRHSVSIKLSALHPRYEQARAAEAVPALSAGIIALAEMARNHGIGLTIDAEEADRLQISLDIIGAVATAPALAGWGGLGMAIQAYQKRAPEVIAWADALGAATGRRIAVRLVKGAYWDSEIKHAQEQGVSGYPVYTRKAATDVSYLACARLMLAADHIAPAFATHNAVTLATLLAWAGDREDVEFQRLHGMGASLYRHALAGRPQHVRVYAPVGGYRDLLAYLVRRLLENGANSSFVHQAGDHRLAIADLLVDPVALVEQNGGAPHPGIALPAHIYGATRRNSEGVDMADRNILATLEQDVAHVPAADSHAMPIIAGQARPGQARALIDPTFAGRAIGDVVEATAEQVAEAITSATRAAPDWAALPAADRAACLDRMADLLERDRTALIRLAVREAGKSLADAVGEVREAVDFCRYYASQARALFVVTTLAGPTGERNELTLAARGVFVCISPWNFPLAIFTGQVAAALVTGNAVIAKPAPQTPLIASKAVQLFHEAGVPAAVLHLLPGGAEVGQAVVADPRIRGVAFTGSTAAAKRIARSLLDDESRPLVPLIAETGGLNAMIVDSSALPEQVVEDVLTSAFRSAGQRCSALRLLCVQDDIADGLIAMLKGAMAELAIGDPGLAATDVGPLIDEDARQRIQAYIDAHRDRVVASLPTDRAPDGHFVAPCIIALDRPEDLTHEIFGPVLHVVRWKAGELDALVDRINASGYGLTMGLHSRLTSAAATVRARAKVGNLYINRAITGAVVGAQPFGGEGLSGTGFKAGGPHFLLRFVTERAVSIDTTSAGGNASLLSLEIADEVAV